LHGALLDAELLADVYLAMTRGQDSLEIMLGNGHEFDEGLGGESEWPPVGLVVLRADPQDVVAHLDLLAQIARESKRPAIWTAIAPSASEAGEFV
jgi:DNA polymerase-3 subunit epsilon